MTNGEPQGWYEDPFKQHEARYFSDGHPTKLVRDGNTESYDEPPQESEAGSGAAAPDIVPQGTLNRADVTGPNPPLDELSANAPARGRAGMRLIAAVVAVAAVVTVVVVVGKSGHGTVAMSPAAFVTKSAQHTLAAHSADVTLTGSVTVLGHNIPVSGTGQADFTANSASLNVAFSMSGHSAAEKEIVADGNLYMTLSVDGQDFSQVTGGRHWIQMPVQQSGTANLGGSNPASALAVLEQQGNTVRSLGTKIVGGVTCTGYSVTVSRKAMIASARKEFAALGLDSATANAELRMIASVQPPTFAVWFDAQGLLREMSLQMSLSLPASGSDGSDGSVGGDIVMDFSNFGAPLRITAPAASDTISYKSFFQTIGGASTF